MQFDWGILDVGIEAGVADSVDGAELDLRAPILEVINGDEPLLVTLITEPSVQHAAYRRRARAVNERSVHQADVPAMLEKGWQIVRSGKRQVRLKQDKPSHQRLEDRAWSLLYHMGYAELSGNRFEIRFKRASGTTGSKQIDAFACDAETALVVECKSKVERGRKNLQKDIAETAALQQYIRQSIYNHIQNKSRPKIIWLYVTHNIIWSESDLDRARDIGIYVVTENEMQYFETFLKHMGPAGRYQILGEFLKGQRIPALTGTKVAAIRGTLGGQYFIALLQLPGFCSR